MRTVVEIEGAGSGYAEVPHGKQAEIRGAELRKTEDGADLCLTFMWPHPVEDNAEALKVLTWRMSKKAIDELFASARSMD